MPETRFYRHGLQRAERGGYWHVWAPRATQVQLVLVDGDRRRPVAMESRAHGWFTHRESEIPTGQRYLFRLDGGREFPDPASRWQPQGVHQPSAVYWPEDFHWSDAAWRGAALQELVIYELHVGTFTSDGNFDAIISRLPALRELGVTCLQLMPVAQFPGRRDWGYDGVHPFAVQESYGGPRALQRLVDVCHANGLAVLLDVVYNHLGPEGNYLAQFGPYFTDRHHTPWGAAWNYDDRGSDEVRALVLDNVRYWLREFHFDGLRLDAVHAIFDDSANHILRDIQRVAEEEADRAGRPLHMIAESNLNDVRLINPPVAGGYGLAALWSDDFHHSVHALLTGERDGYYIDFGRPEHLVKAINQCFVYDGCYSQFRGRPHGGPSGAHKGERFVTSIQNHDQIGNRAAGDRLSVRLSPTQLRLAAALLLLSPYTPLLFMGEEYGESRPFPYFCDFQDEQVVEAVRAGRRLEFASFAARGPIPDAQAIDTFNSAILTWDWPPGSWRAGLRRWYQDLLSARRCSPPLGPSGPRQAIWHARPVIAGNENDTSPGSPTGILELQRGGRDEPYAPPLVAYFNFSPQSQSISHHPGDPAARWRCLLSSEWPCYGGLRYDDSREGTFAGSVCWRLLPWEVLVLGRK